MKLLIVDDSKVTRTQIRSSIEKMEAYNFEIFEAATGAEAVSLYEAHEPDLTLLDYLLPDTTGLEIIRGMSEGKDYLPIVMVTGFDDVQLVVDAMRMGVQGYLVKDRLQPDTLYLAVEDALQRIRIHKEVEQKRKLEQFAYMLAYDMKKKVGSVDDILKLLKDQTADQEKLIEFLCLANKVAEQMKDFSHELLDYAIMNSGAAAPQKKIAEPS